ncbi:L-aspartate oxidase [Chondrinema litorale]|uniref:L-aspartate oxidase n=1 Tax=Chondrinema litorale TaxID=2994555 RepID=UPI002543A717|nr:L-aspartate oxidase [Chondrinema litorale]UZR96604.1 L-aspartate oxidase [Chondrinema litorale]
MRFDTDFLVIGSGLAGLAYALKVANKLPEAKVTIVTKADEGESNTRYAQGGIAVMLDKDEDSFKKHIKDTLIAGDGLCDKEVVKMVVKKGPKRFREITGWGAEFDKQPSGDYDLGREGGHSVNRIVHHKDVTGWEMSRTLLKQVHSMPNIEILSYHFAIDLITEHHFKVKPEVKPEDVKCYGAYVLNQKTKQIERILSKVTLLGSGGTGHVYRNTTNPLVATGDGIAMAYRAKAFIQNMEFIQFHPTSLYNPGVSPSFLISEAVRGFGAKLRTKSGEPFMHKYDEREELASRDIVARAIDSELKISGDDFVYLDCRHLEMEGFKKHFPNIYEKCASLGIYAEKDMIPVVPAAHYLCGGINVDMNGRTNVENLYACGECSNTGLHGANRLASNSLLEALVYAHKCYKDGIKKYDSIEIPAEINEWNAEGTVEPKEKIVITHMRKELQTLMSDLVGIVRSNERLRLAKEKLHFIYKETKKLYDNSTLSPQLCELRNLVTIAYLIIEQSIQRKENRGGYFNKDLE